MSNNSSTSNLNLILPQVENSDIIFKESLITIKRDTLCLKGGEKYHYYTLLVKPFSVVILAITTDNKYVFIEEYRHPVGRTLLSCPGGYLDEAETPLDAAKRELLEETGFEADSFTLMGSAYPYAGISNQKTFYVKATGAKAKTLPHLEPSEILQTTLKTKEELYQLIQQGIELDGPLCTALFFETYIAAS